MISALVHLAPSSDGDVNGDEGGQVDGGGGVQGHVGLEKVSQWV